MIVVDETWNTAAILTGIIITLANFGLNPRINFISYSNYVKYALCIDNLIAIPALSAASHRRPSRASAVRYLFVFILILDERV